MVYRDEVFAFEPSGEGEKTSSQEASKKDVAGQKSTAADQKSAAPGQKPTGQAAGNKKNASQAVTLTVAPGSSVDEIGEQLKSLGVIKDKKEFLAEVSRQKASAKIVAGTYKIATGTGIGDVVKILTESYQQ